MSELESLIEQIGEEQYKAMMTAHKSVVKTIKTEPKQSASIVEVKDKYGSLTGYRVTVNTIKKGKLTSIIKIGGRISKNDAQALAEEEKSRLIRKYKI